MKPFAFILMSRPMSTLATFTAIMSNLTCRTQEQLFPLHIPTAIVTYTHFGNGTSFPILILVNQALAIDTFIVKSCRSNSIHIAQISHGSKVMRVSNDEIKSQRKGEFMYSNKTTIVCANSEKSTPSAPWISLLIVSTHIHQKSFPLEGDFKHGLQQD